MGTEHSDPRRPRWPLAGGVVLAVVTALGVLLASSDSDPRRALPSKEISHLYDLRGPEAFVLPAEPGEAEATRLRGAMDASPAVERYLYLPYGWATLHGLPSAELRRALVRGEAVERCPEMLTPAFLVDLDVDRASSAADLDVAIAPARRVFSTDDDPFRLFSEHPSRDRTDLEVFMEVDATPEQVAAVRGALEADPRFVVVRHLTKSDADDEFRRIFADDPEILDDFVPGGLPESFRLVLADRRVDPIDDLSVLDGVDEVIRTAFHGLDVDVGRRPIVTRAYGPAEVEVFMAVDATEAEVAAVSAVLADDPRVASVTHVSKQQALQEFRRVFADDPELVSAVGVDALPESFRVVLDDEAQGDPFRDRIGIVHGVDEVVLPFDGPAWMQVCPPQLR